MSDMDKGGDGFGHEDVEFILRERGLETSANLSSQLKDLEDSLITGEVEASEAIAQAHHFTRRLGGIVVTQFAVLERRIQDLERDNT